MARVILVAFVIILAGCTATGQNNTIDVSTEFTSTDPDYGYSESKPVSLGGFLRGTQYEGAHIQYFESLRGPNGEQVQVRRLGSCCAFEDASMPFGGGLLDKYQLTYAGQTEPKIIFVNLYKFEKPMAPLGFKLL